MGDYVALAVIVVMLTAAIIYIIKQRKNGAKCIGCPPGCKACGNSKSKSSCYCGCNIQQNDK